jgi:hypothetical protein
VTRATELERILAYAGIVLWIVFVILSVLPPLDPLGAGIGAIATVLSIRELARWRRGERHTTGPKSGQPIYPGLAWFGCGAVSATILTAIAMSIASGPRPVPADGELTLLQVAVWLVGGFATEWFLVHRARARDAATVDAPPLPPPPPALPQAPEERRDRGWDVPVQDRAAFPEDPRARA